MTKIYFVDRSMCGQELPADFDLEEFCETLQGKLRGVEIVPLLDPNERAVNRDPDLVPPEIFFEALGEYCPR